MGGGIRPQSRGTRKRLIREATRERIRLEKVEVAKLQFISRGRFEEAFSLRLFRDVPSVLAIAIQRGLVV
jgi:hypothetical protein